MFSPICLGLSGSKQKFGFDENDGFRRSDFEGRVRTTYDDTMNSPAKRGRYSMAADEALDRSIKQKRDGWKQCEYVSNRTRLRCQNMREAAELKDYGFCEEHLGYIERIRNEGLRTKHIFDPNFAISESFMELISNDDDETLEPHLSADFPFVYESLYCDNRIDNDDNSLRHARVYTKKEILREYIRSLDRWHAALQEQREIYQEKHLRVVHQIGKLRGQTYKVLLDPAKDVEKVKRLLAMRRIALCRDQKRVLHEKFERMDKWKPASKEEPGTDEEPQQPKPPETELLEKLTAVVEQNMLVCARVNRPWDGTRKMDTDQHLQQPQPSFSRQSLPNYQQLDEAQSSSSLTSQKKQPQSFHSPPPHPIQNNRRKTSVHSPDKHSLTESTMATAAATSSGSGSGTGGGISSYQQYLSQQRLISINAVRPALIRQQLPLSRQQFLYQQQQQQHMPAYRYGNGLAPPPAQQLPRQQQLPVRESTSRGRGRGRGRFHRPNSSSSSSVVNVDKTFPNS